MWQGIQSLSSLACPLLIKLPRKRRSPSILLCVNSCELLQWVMISSRWKARMWEKWRRIFYPGFSTTHLASLVPEVVRELGVFCQILRERKLTFLHENAYEQTDYGYHRKMFYNGWFIMLFIWYTQLTWWQRHKIPISKLDISLYLGSAWTDIPWLSFGTEINLRRWRHQHAQ